MRDSRGSAKAATLSSGITRAERLNDCKNFRRERRKWRTTPEKQVLCYNPRKFFIVEGEPDCKAFSPTPLNLSSIPCRAAPLGEGGMMTRSLLGLRVGIFILTFLFAFWGLPALLVGQPGLASTSDKLLLQIKTDRDGKESASWNFPALRAHGSSWALWVLGPAYSVPKVAHSRFGSILSRSCMTSS